MINEEGTFSLDIGNDDSVDCAGTYVDTKTGVKANYSEKVDGTDVSKNIEFTKKETDVLLGSVNEKETYFVKSTNETPNLNGTWKNSEGTITTIINNESKKIYVKDGETEIWGTIVQKDNMFILQDEESNVIGTGFVSAAGNAYIYNEATGTYEIFTRNGSATESDSKIPSKMFTVTYKSEFAKDDVQEKEEGTVLELPTPLYKGYRFDGWYTDEGKTAKAAATYTIAENLTFYAKWVQQGTVKFTSAQSEHADKVVDIGTEITIEDPSKEKFDFDGWFIGETKVSGKYTVTKDVELVAIWTALYNVTFDPAGGSPVSPIENVRDGAEITLPKGPTTKLAATFEYWTIGENKYNPDDKYTVTSDVIFSAKWSGLYTVVYTGVDYQTETYPENSAVILPPAPEKEGYVFKGWEITGETELMQPNDAYTLTGNVTINAKWVAVYTCYYYEGHPTEGPTPTEEEGTVLTLKEPRENYGYVFKGWSDGENIYQPGYEYTITKDVVFTAIWVELFTYDYFKNYGEVGEIDPSTLLKAEDGSEITVGPAIERPGYVFKGWSVDEQTYQPGDKYTITKDTVFTAEWNPEYTYQFEGSETETVENGTKITIANALEAEDCTFAGWSDGTKTYQPGVEYEITDNVSFTAVWNVTVTYVSKYSQPAAIEIKKGDSLVLPTLDYDGYSFGGWFADVDVEVESPYTVDANITLTAKWTKDSVAYSISGVPTNETWTSGTVVAWVWDDDVETGFDVKPTFDKGTADYSFETAEDIKYCTIFVVDSMPSEPVTKDALTENATAKSADMDISSGNAVFETYKEVYTITNVASWWGSDNAQSFVKISSATGESYLIEGVYDSENAIVTFVTDYDFDTCVLLRFGSGVAPEDTDLSSYTNNELKNRSILLVMDENNTAVFAEEKTKLADTNTVFFRDECSWRYHSPNGQNIEKGENVVAHFSSTSDPSLTLEVPMTLHHESWLSATVDYTKYDTVYFSGRDSGGSVEKTESLSMDVLKIFYRVGSSGKNQSGNYKLYSYTDTTQDDD